MEKFDIYNDISLRTGGDIYIGVVGPVRTGKSTFITKFMENFVIPNISNKLQKQIATDEMPQSADGKTVMTTQPKFVPGNSVKVQFKNKSSANVRLIDCVGYFVEGALGTQDGDKPRLVKTPWDDNEIPFEKAAEIGTKKVIEEYSTIGILVTTDGSFGEIKREEYVSAEEKSVKDLKKCGKPFIILLNSANPDSETAIKLANQLEDKYGVSVVCTNVSTFNASDINDVMNKILMEFPICGFNLDIPEWIRALPENNPLILKIISEIKEMSMKLTKMRDFSIASDVFKNDEDFYPIEVGEISLSDGFSRYKLSAKDGLFYKVLSGECGEEIKDEYSLISYIKEFSESKNKFTKIKDALTEAEENGYGVVMPTLDEMNLQEPELVKQNGRFGVKLKATAPSLHIMKVDVGTEVSPIVGTKQQGEDLINYITSKYENNPSAIWDTNMFGKSLYDLVNEGLIGKINSMPKDTQNKMRKTVTRIVNESRGGVICILL